jgi:hypothetical protein
LLFSDSLQSPLYRVLVPSEGHLLNAGDLFRIGATTFRVVQAVKVEGQTQVNPTGSRGREGLVVPCLQVGSEDFF